MSSGADGGSWAVHKRRLRKASHYCLFLSSASVPAFAFLPRAPVPTSPHDWLQFQTDETFFPRAVPVFITAVGTRTRIVGEGSQERG